MKFIVLRASQFTEQQPCEEAKEEEFSCRNKILKRWTMEFNSLEEIINFKSKYGDIVIRDSWFFDGIQEIIIYDDYLE
jgi:hypothetical protein